MDLVLRPTGVGSLLGDLDATLRTQFRSPSLPALEPALTAQIDSGLILRGRFRLLSFTRG